MSEYGDFLVFRGERSWNDDAQEFAGNYRELLKDWIAMIARAHGIGVKRR